MRLNRAHPNPPKGRAYETNYMIDFNLINDFTKPPLRGGLEGLV
jgi:hypothetical protein